MFSLQKVTRGFAVCCLLRRKLITVYRKGKVNTAPCSASGVFLKPTKGRFFTSPECLPPPQPTPPAPGFLFPPVESYTQTLPQHLYGKHASLENTSSPTEPKQCGTHSFVHSFIRDMFTNRCCGSVGNKNRPRQMAQASGRGGWHTGTVNLGHSDALTG